MVEIKIIPMGTKGPKQKKTTVIKKRAPLPSRHSTAVDPNMKRAVTGMMRRNAVENKPLTEKQIKKLVVQQMKFDRLYSDEEFNAEYERVKESMMLPYNGPAPINHNIQPTNDEIVKKNIRKEIVRSNRLVRKQQEQKHSNARSLRKERMLEQQRQKHFQSYELYKFRKQQEDKR